jgi:hypothetical protein
MKLKVYGGGTTFNVRVDGTDNVLEVSKGLTAYEAVHEIASWLELLTEPAPVEPPAPETQPAPASPTVVTELVPMAPAQPDAPVEAASDAPVQRPSRRPRAS